MTNPKRQRANDAYEHAHLEATGALDEILELLHDLPAPDNDECPINWAHVGDLTEVNRRLDSIIAFLNGTEQ